MDKDAIKQMALILDASLSTSTKKWWGITCPLAEWNHQHGTDSHPSFRVEINPDGRSKLRCFSCGWGGSLYDLAFELKFHKASVDLQALAAIADQEQESSGFKLGDDEEEHDPTIITPYPDYWMDSFVTVFNSGQALHYLEGREGGPVPKHISAQLDLRWDHTQKRICFPYRLKSGVSVGLHGRCIYQSEMPYFAYPFKGKTNPQCLIGEQWIDFNKPVVVAESVFDMARALEVYDNVVTPRTANIVPLQMDRLLEAGKIITLFDADKAGYTARARLEKYVQEKSPYTSVSHIHLEDGMDAGKTPVAQLAYYIGLFVDLDHPPP